MSLTGGKRMDKMLELRTKLAITTSVQEFMEVMKRKIKISVSREALEKLEENELFASATKEGFSKEELKGIIVPILDYIIENIDIERIQNSKTMALIQVFIAEKDIDISTIDGETIFELLDSKEVLKELCYPEFKKQVVFAEAAGLAINQGNISFNTAIKRTIGLMQSGSPEFWGIEEDKKEIDEILNIINNLVDFYLDNEALFILEFVTKK